MNIIIIINILFYCSTIVHHMMPKKLLKENQCFEWFHRVCHHQKDVSSTSKNEIVLQHWNRKIKIRKTINNNYIFIKIKSNEWKINIDIFFDTIVLMSPDIYFKICNSPFSINLSIDSWEVSFQIMLIHSYKLEFCQSIHYFAYKIHWTSVIHWISWNTSIQRI